MAVRGNLFKAADTSSGNFSESPSGRLAAHRLTGVVSRDGAEPSPSTTLPLPEVVTGYGARPRHRVPRRAMPWEVPPRGPGVAKVIRDGQFPPSLSCHRATARGRRRNGEQEREGILACASAHQRRCPWTKCLDLQADCAFRTGQLPGVSVRIDAEDVSSRPGRVGRCTLATLFGVGQQVAVP